MALLGFRVLPFFCGQEIVDLICGEIDCKHKLVDWFVQSGDLNDHFTF
jgi:hypothetical protein